MNWQDLQYFLAVSKEGTLSKAAISLKVNHSTVLRRIKFFEDNYNARLFDRVSGEMKLTQLGQDILSKVKLINEFTDDIDRTITGRDLRLQGAIKVSTTDSLAYMWVVPLLKDFLKLHPEIVVDLDISTRSLNLSKREADVVISAGRNQPANLIGRRLGVIPMVLVGHRNYLKKSEIKNFSYGDWSFIAPNENLFHVQAAKWFYKHIPQNCIVLRSDKFYAMKCFVEEQVGLAVLPKLLLLKNKSLVIVKELPVNCASNIWILTHPDLRNVSRIKVFMKFLADRLARNIESFNK